MRLSCAARTRACGSMALTSALNGSDRHRPVEAEASKCLKECVGVDHPGRSGKHPLVVDLGVALSPERRIVHVDVGDLPRREGEARSSEVPCDVYHCQQSSSRPTLSAPIRLMGSSVPAIVEMNS